MLTELRLKDFGGQQCDVVLVKREDGSKYVRFESVSGYGHPSVEANQLVEILQRVKALE